MSPFQTFIKQTMKSIITITICVYAVVIAYTDVDDTYDIDSLVKNTTELKKYLDCFIEKGPCTTKCMKASKGHLVEAINDACAECDSIQKHMLHMFLLGIREKIPDELKDFQEKYDPSGTHLSAAEKALNKY